MSELDESSSLLWLDSDWAPGEWWELRAALASCSCLLAGMGEMKDRTLRLNINGFVSPDPPTLAGRGPCSGAELPSVKGLMEVDADTDRAGFGSSVGLLVTSGSTRFELDARGRTPWGATGAEGGGAAVGGAVL